MKLEKLKATFQNKYAIRVIAGVLIIAVTGGASTAAYTPPKANRDALLPLRRKKRKIRICRTTPNPGNRNKKKTAAISPWRI